VPVDKAAIPFEGCALAPQFLQDCAAAFELPAGLIHRKCFRSFFKITRREGLPKCVKLAGRQILEEYRGIEKEAAESVQQHI
jgi:hypothetical protein